MKTEPVYLHLAKGDYVLIPKANYVRLCGQHPGDWRTLNFNARVAGVKLPALRSGRGAA
jgi:hypothetical protein